MKNTILILFLFLTITSCTQQAKKESANEQIKSTENNLDNKNNEITIKYSTPIKGYNVTAKWLIRGKLEVKWSENFSGPAILTFENIKTKKISWVLHPEFTIDIDKKNLKFITVKDDEFIKNQSFTQIAKYINPKFEKVGTSKEEEGFGYTYIPFFFQDVDFDYKDELILTYATTYEKGGAQNKIFKTPGDVIEDDLEFIEMTDEPFSRFSGFYYGNPSADHYNYTSIDYKNKTITISGMSGAGGHGSIDYEFKKSEYNGYQLFKKTDVNNYNNWEVEETTISTYDVYREIIKVEKTKTTNG